MRVFRYRCTRRSGTTREWDVSQGFLLHVFFCLSVCVCVYVLSHPFSSPHATIPAAGCMLCPQRDDGWRSMGGEEQALLYTLEEISGSDYRLQEDPHGGSHVSVMFMRCTSPGPISIITQLKLLSCKEHVFFHFQTTWKYVVCAGSSRWNVFKDALAGTVRCRCCGAIER